MPALKKAIQVVAVCSLAGSTPWLGLGLDQQDQRRAASAQHVKAQDLSLFASSAFAAPYLGIPNGEECTANAQCQSGTCYPGPGDGSVQYCMAHEKNCALPGSDGVMYRFRYEGMVCLDPGGGGRARIAVPGGSGCGGGWSKGWFGVCYPNIGGTFGKSFEHVKREVIGQAGGHSLALWLVTSRETAIRDAKPVPAAIREQLRGYIPETVLDAARYKVGDTGIINAAHAIQLFNRDVAAVTLIDVIVFRNGRDAETELELWAHELTHVQQFMEMGVRNFGIRYARHSDDLEDEAYEKGNGYYPWRRTFRLAAPSLSTRNIPNGQQCSSNAECQSGSCYPGPGDGSIQYCMARDRNCALPGSDGVMYGFRYQGMVCLNPGGGGRARITS